MEDRLRRHIDDLFAGAPYTVRTVELQEEMLQNLTEKYNDLIAEGKNEEAAYNIAIASIGDVRKLIEDINRSDNVDTELMVKAKQKSALLTAVAVMLYILSILPPSILGSRLGESVGLTLFIVMVAAATGLLIYNNMTKPRYIRQDDSMVEEFKEWQESSSSRKSLRGAISGVLWTLILSLYFIVSFTWGAWHITWVIFILGAAAEAIISICFLLKK